MNVFRIASLFLLGLTLAACSQPTPVPVVWMEGSEHRFVDCFIQGYSQGVAKEGVTASKDLYWIAFDTFYDCDLERTNRTFSRVADFMDCTEQAAELYRSKYGDLSSEAVAVVEDEMDVLYAKTLCWPANELKELPDADDFAIE